MTLPAPFFQDESVTLYHGDAFEIMPCLPKAALVLTDPPYFTQAHEGARRNTPDGPVKLVDFEAFDEEKTLRAFAMMGALTKRWVVSFVDYHAIPILEEKTPDGLHFIRFGVWVKDGGAPQFSGDRPGMGWEAIAFLHASADRPQWHGGGRSGVFRGRVVKGHGRHPTQKPDSLVRELIELFTGPGDLVIDPFAGSGVVLRVAREIGRRAIGVEQDRRWCDRAVENLAQLAFELCGSSKQVIRLNGQDGWQQMGMFEDEDDET